MNPPSSSHILKLPQLCAHFSEVHAQEYLFVAGGRPPVCTWLRDAAGTRPLWAIDRGLDAVFEAGLTPVQLIGDDDSASPRAWKKASELKIPSETFPSEKDFTDTDLALRMMKAEDSSAFIILSGAFGGRFDHAFSTMYSLLGAGLRGCLADETECLFFLRESSSLTVEFHRLPSAVSLLPLTAKVTGVSLSGVHWPLKDAMLHQEETLSVSNRLAEGKNTCTASLSSGSMGVYFVWDENALRSR